MNTNVAMPAPRRLKSSPGLYACAARKLALTMMLLVALPIAVAATGYRGEGPTEGEAAWVAAHVGMYVWGPAPEKELRSTNRTAVARMALRLGARTVRCGISMYAEPWRWDYDPRARTFIDILRRQDWQALIAMHDTIMLTLGDASGHAFEPEWTRESYRKLTEYLLSTYADRPKTFVLGIWEGDHWLTESSMAGDPSRVGIYVRYFAARHDGILAGRAAVPRSRSKVHEMIEMVSLDYTGKQFLVNRVIPHTRADLYSLSAWGYQYELRKAFGYIKTKAPDSRAFGARNCMLGEAGGPPVWEPPGARIAGIRRILADAKAWGAPYVTWWELVSPLWVGGLRTPYWDGGVKSSSYYWFYRAYHYRDDPLVVDDFEADPDGPAGGDYSEEGRPLNRIGGVHSVAGGAFSCLVPGGARGRALFLRFARAGQKWTTGLMRMDGRKFSNIRFRLRRLMPLVVALEDHTGRVARVPVARAAASDALKWRTIVIPMTAFRGVDRGDMERLSIISQTPGECSLDEVTFAATGRRPAALWPIDAPVPKASQMVLRSSRQILPLPPSAGRRPSFLRFVANFDRDVVKPRLADGITEIRLADRLLPGQMLELTPGGTGRLRFGPLGYHLDIRRPEAAGLTIHNLTGHPEYHAFTPAGDGKECWAQWRWVSDFPVRHFRIVLNGTRMEGANGRAAILVSADGRRWTEARVDPRTWDETVWIGRPPDGFEPTRSFWVRFKLLPDMARRDWEWTVGMSDFKIELWLDNETVMLPGPAGLEYRDDGSSSSLRGLMDLDW